MVLHFSEDFKDSKNIGIYLMIFIFKFDIPMLFIFSNNGAFETFILEMNRIPTDSRFSFIHFTHFEYILPFDIPFVAQVTTHRYHRFKQSIHFNRKTNQFNCSQVTKYLDALHWNQEDIKSQWILFTFRFMKILCQFSICQINRDFVYLF